MTLIEKLWSWFAFFDTSAGLVNMVYLQIIIAAFVENWAWIRSNDTDVLWRNVSLFNLICAIEIYQRLEELSATLNWAVKGLSLTARVCRFGIKCFSLLNYQDFQRQMQFFLLNFLVTSHVLKKWSHVLCHPNFDRRRIYRLSAIFFRLILVTR